MSRTAAAAGGSLEAPVANSCPGASTGRPSIRAAWRLARTGAHLAGGVATVALRFPRIDIGHQRQLKQRWSARLLAILGVELSHDVHVPDGRVLLVANHVSWLDIFAINAIAPAAFVAKSDVRVWAVIGWLCERTETLFMARGNRVAAHRAQQRVSATLAEERVVAVFPEGTTSEGTSVLPFHGALLQPAIDAEAQVMALALRYTDGHGRHTAAPAYAGDTTLWQSLRAIAAGAGLKVRIDAVCCLRAGDYTAHGGRRELAGELREAIARALA